MTPAARLQAAIDILGIASDQPLERLAKAFWRERRYAGGGDRRAVGEMLFAIARGRAHFAHRMGCDTPRALVIAALLAEGRDPQTLFTGGYGPEPLSDAERAAIAATPAPAPVWVEGEYPQFLESELQRAFGDGLLEEMAALSMRAPVDLRVNRLKAEPAGVLAALKDSGVDCAPMAYMADGIRCATETRNLDKHELFLSGAFEIQDQASQIAVRLCGVGTNVLDLAAGAGGKSLALAAAMQNQGVITACDIRGAALAELEKRAARAGATNIKTHIGAAPPGTYDIVLVDAPCSGSGTWRRQPDNKWRLTPQKLAALMAVQDDLLDQAASRVASGGRLVYATCSVLPCENDDRMAAFAARHADFTARDASAAWDGPPVPGLGQQFRASPAKTGTDGFFCAILSRI